MSPINSNLDDIENVEAEIIPHSHDDTECSIPNKNTSIRGMNNKTQEQHSSQENLQDMDQEQNVDVKPSQVNVQRLEVSINNKIENYSGKITGVVYKEDGDTVSSNTELQLYFGSHPQYPVYITTSDKNGAFNIADLPPGFYTLKAFIDKIERCMVVNIKVLPGENCYQTILLDKSSLLEKSFKKTQRELYRTW